MPPNTKIGTCTEITRQDKYSSEEDLEVTDYMLREGVGVLNDYGECFDQEQLVHRIYTTMQAARRKQL